MDRRRLTVNHHVDEKYRKLALDSVKKLERDIDRWSYCFFMSDAGARHRDGTSAALNMEQHGAGKRNDIVNEN